MDAVAADLTAVKVAEVVPADAVAANLTAVEVTEVALANTVPVDLMDVEVSDVNQWPDGTFNTGIESGGAFGSLCDALFENIYIYFLAALKVVFPGATSLAELYKI